MKDLEEFSYDEQYAKLRECCPDVVATMAGLMMPGQNFDCLEVVDSNFFNCISAYTGSY